MKTNKLHEWERLQQQLRTRDAQILELECQLVRQQSDWEPAAREWRRLESQRRDLAEWLIDSATNEYGRLVRPVIDAALGGDPFIPCSFSGAAGGKRYRLALVSTDYEVTEIPNY